MLPAGPLMIEHRLIERMIKVLDGSLQNMQQGKELDLNFIDTVVDFIRTYADRCHHGKEEDILFRDLSKKQISAEHKRIMQELIQEHIYGRKTVSKIIEAKAGYLKGDKNAADIIIISLGKLVEFYPKHIEKEDKHFFIPCMDYFTTQEKDDMLKEFAEFDKRLIHEKYTRTVEKYEK